MAISMAILSGIVVSVMMVFNGQLSRSVYRNGSNPCLRVIDDVYRFKSKTHFASRPSPCFPFFISGWCNRGIHCLFQQSDHYDFGSFYD